MTLRRTGPPARHTPLARGAELARTAPFPRRVRTLAEVRASRPQVAADERTARALVRTRSQGRCEGCPAPEGTDWSHRVARSRTGQWTAQNGLLLCRGCHRFCHDQPVMARSIGWVVRTDTDPLAVPALLHGRGWTLLTADGGYAPAPEPNEGDVA